MQFLLRALTRVPLSILYALGALMYFVAFYLMHWRRDRAEHDVANAFPEKDRAERAAIVRRSYRNLADTLMETFWGFGASAEAIKKRVTFENPGLVTACHDAERSVILLTAHYGNWEWLSLAAGAHFDMTIDVVYQPQRVAAFNDFLREARARFGSRFIPRKEFIFDLMSRADKARTYALIAVESGNRVLHRSRQDRAVSRRDGALRVDAAFAARILCRASIGDRSAAVRRGCRYAHRRTLCPKSRAGHPRQPGGLAVVAEEVEVRQGGGLLTRVLALVYAPRFC